MQRIDLKSTINEESYYLLRIWTYC